MSITQLINDGLQYLTNRRDNMAKKTRYPAVGKTHVVCGSCSGEIVETNKNTRRRACFDCGKEVK